MLLVFFLSPPSLDSRSDILPPGDTAAWQDWWKRSVRFPGRKQPLGESLCPRSVLMTLHCRQQDTESRGELVCGTTKKELQWNQLQVQTYSSTGQVLAPVPWCWQWGISCTSCPKQESVGEGKEKSCCKPPSPLSLWDIWNTVLKFFVLQHLQVTSLIN